MRLHLGPATVSSSQINTVFRTFAKPGTRSSDRPYILVNPILGVFVGLEKMKNAQEKVISQKEKQGDRSAYFLRVSFVSISAKGRDFY